MNYVISLMKEIVRHGLDAGPAYRYGTDLFLHLPGGI